VLEVQRSLGTAENASTLTLSSDGLADVRDEMLSRRIPTLDPFRQLPAAYSRLRENLLTFNAEPRLQPARILRQQES
jgi:hypothetical protein